MEPVNYSSTFSEGKTYVGQNGKYIGEIDTYKGFFQVFFAKLFGWSIAVDVSGKTRNFDKESYRQFLRQYNVPISSAADVKKYTKFAETIITSKDFASDAEFAQLEKLPILLRNKIPAKKVARLTSKLHTYLKEQNSSSVEKIVQLIKKGAIIDKYLKEDDRTLSPFLYAQLYYKEGEKTEILNCLEEAAVQKKDGWLGNAQKIERQLKYEDGEIVTIWNESRCESSSTKDPTDPNIINNMNITLYFTVTEKGGRKTEVLQKEQKVYEKITTMNKIGRIRTGSENQNKDLQNSTETIQRIDTKIETKVYESGVEKLESSSASIRFKK